MSGLSCRAPFTIVMELSEVDISVIGSDSAHCKLHIQIHSAIGVMTGTNHVPVKVINIRCWLDTSIKLSGEN